MTAGQINSDVQRLRSKTGEAVGQCVGCGAFRLDGLPPSVHRTGCRTQAHENEPG